ncbi:MAG: hypothetical protein JXB39_09365 [Deltaproteobacteria bacterium]|nr:hypothetical protein [Deltaproteobacteria bacterium]
MRDAASPFMGDCAVYPEGVYEYGEIGIGTCLSTPADLAFLERDDHGWSLAVSNGDAFHVFTGGSVLFLDWDSIDLDASTNVVSDLESVAVAFDPLPGTLVEIPDRDLLAVPVRDSAGANTRTEFDDVRFLDVADPRVPAPATAGFDGGDAVEVEADPFALAYDPSSGYLFVGNRTSHTISVLDALATPIADVDTVGRAWIGGRRWFDSDSSGSKAAFSVLQASDASLLEDETWSLAWVDGTYTLWVPEEGGLRRWTSGGDGTWTEGAYGVELHPDDSDGLVSCVTDPTRYTTSSGRRMAFASDGSIRSATAGQWGADWSFDEDALLEPSEDAWDRFLGGPCVVTSEGVSWLFYDGSGPEGTRIGVARATGSGDLHARAASGLPVLEPGGAHDVAGQADPFVVWDEVLSVWRMWYSAWDGERWTLGEAVSDDLETWEARAAPALALDGADAASPEVAFANGGVHLWYLRRDDPDPTWRVAWAESVDGTTWFDHGPILEDDRSGPGLLTGPRGLAIEVEQTQAFRVEGRDIGPLAVLVSCGSLLESTTHGWQVQVVAGEALDLGDAGSASANGLAVASVLPDEDLAWLDLVDDRGVPVVGFATWDGERLDPWEGAVLEPARGTFDAEGVHSPTVFRDQAGRYVMLYAGTRGGLTRVGRATSLDGVTWTRDSGAILDLGSDWDSVAMVPGSVETLEDGTFRLWYAGSDGVRFRIGAAVSDDGAAWTRAGDGDWILGTGSPGSWDDSSVSDPWVARSDGVLHLWYTGYDGSVNRIGHAVSDPEGLDWTRDRDADENPVYRMEGTASLFDYGGVERPVAFRDEAGWVMFYRGRDGLVFRPGLALGPEASAVYKAPCMPTPGDHLDFSTRRGSPGDDPVDLDVTVDGTSFTGSGLDALFVDADRGLLWAGSKLVNYVFAVDIRDDSETGFDDANVLGLEAVVVLEAATGSPGVRDLALDPGSSRLLALSDGPEGVLVLDADRVEDDARPDVVRGAITGFLPAPRGSERDLGAVTVSDVGPAQMALLPDGVHLAVANFNQNSLSLYDLRMGAWGQMIGESEFLGENPSAVAVTPDGRYAVVACYEGELDEEAEQVDSTLAVVDVDPSSPSFLEVVTWIVNR